MTQEIINNPLGFASGNIDDVGLSDEQKLEFEKQQKEQKDLNRFYKMCFETDAGKKVIEDLRKNTVNAGTWLASLGYENGIAHGFAREGQNSMYRYIEDRIVAANNEKDNE